MKLTIGIKAFNEERHIAVCLESALAAARPFGGEVVLADSDSGDHTVEIARGYPVRIVQLADPSERSCGAGAQLAFQYARGEYFYLLDGDMILQPGFIDAGIVYLDTHRQVAGVGGRVREMNTQNEAFQIRAAQTQNHAGFRPGSVDQLDCGGLYRAAAIRDVGYFADRNLHAFEEFELGARLRRAGWTLVRIDKPAVEHFGHRTGGYRLLLRHLRSGYAAGAGEVLRSALGQPQLPIVLKSLGHIRHVFAVMAWWFACLWALLAPPAAANRGALLFVLAVAPIVFFSIRRKGPRLGLYSFVTWNVVAAGCVVGFFRRRVSPRKPLAAVELTH